MVAVGVETGNIGSQDIRSRSRERNANLGTRNNRYTSRNNRNNRNRRSNRSNNRNNRNNNNRLTRLKAKPRTHHVFTVVGHAFDNGKSSLNLPEGVHVEHIIEPGKKLKGYDYCTDGKQYCPTISSVAVGLVPAIFSIEKELTISSSEHTKNIDGVYVTIEGKVNRILCFGEGEKLTLSEIAEITQHYSLHELKFSKNIRIKVITCRRTRKNQESSSYVIHPKHADPTTCPPIYTKDCISFGEYRQEMK